MGKALAEIVRGKDAFAIPWIVSEMDTLTPNHPSIKAAFEMALWDICGKIAGQPVHRLLGTYRDSFETDQTVFIDTPEAMSQQAKEIASQGFKRIKVKVGQGPREDAARLAAIRDTVGKDAKLRIDANQGWTPSVAVQTLRALEKYDVEFCEQPVAYWDWTGLKYVRSHVGIPIMADEAVHSPQDALHGIREDAMDMINVKLMKSGGILHAVAIAQIAAAANINCMLGCMSEGRIALTAAAHVVASQKNCLYADLDAFLFQAFDPVIGGMQLTAGTVSVPDAPGLGLDIDPAFLRTLRAA
jgi:L-alanine-DL-glutamate epimerase-like enolase superfamily enzyme